VTVACFILGALLAVALIDYSPRQTSFHGTNPTEANLVGGFGANFSFIAFFSLGIAAAALPVFLWWTAYVAVRHPRRVTYARVIAMLACIASFCGLAAMFEIKPGDFFPHGPGGLLGEMIYTHFLSGTLGLFGSLLVLGLAYFFCLLYVFVVDIGGEFDKLFARFHAWREERAQLRALLAEDRRKTRAEAAAAKPEPAKSARAPLVLAPAEPGNKNVLVAKSGEASIPAAKTAPEAPERPDPRPAAGKGKIELNIVKPEETRKARVVVPQRSDADYQFPPLSLLKEQVRPTAANSEEEHRRNAENLLRILGEFGVEVTLGEIHVGPVITRYELVPAPGVRVEKISGLDKNIALGMRAQSVRILAPIPGKAAVGVEVPNQHPTPVGLREILESEDWSSAKAELPIALGKDVSGKPLISDLAKMPHLLIAGATGSGKSVCINSIVASILYSQSPRDVRLIMVDPKVVELKVFNSLPHMLIPVLTEPKKVPAALKWLLGEMEQRYQIFAKVNVRNIVGFNHRRKTPATEVPPAETQPALEGLDPLAADDGIEIPERLPYIVAIVDELADLMMIAPAEIETNIARLAQLARAAGIHLIIATQRPSVNVVTGVIKANLPSRIAFQVASQVDSRTIIDTKGAETLIGRGDLLFTPPATSKIVRAQGAYVADEEIQAIVDHMRKHNDPPVYAQAVQQHIDRTAREEDEDGEDLGEDGELGDDEELFQQALDVLKSTRRASTSMLQRRLRIGYNRAARIMEIMEEKGIVGPENGSSPREILTDLDKL
jgi:S-DNA-T family DNA segregation ATPase FtsK/SpoIIIE